MIKYPNLYSSRIIVKCILGIIIFSLVISAVNSYIKKDTPQYAATVNGEKISIQMLNNMYFIEREKQKKILGKNFFKIKNNKKFIKDTYNYVLSQLINNVLLEQYTKKINFKINKNIAKETILRAPIFQKNNKFNQAKYFNYLLSIHSTNHEYIKTIENRINTQNLLNSIISTNFILNDEKKYIIKLLSQKRKIKTATLKIQSVIDQQNVTNLESYDYFIKNKNNFYIPEKFKISFIQLKPDQSKVKISSKEIEEWYQKNIDQFYEKEKRRYSIIQIKTKSEGFKILSQLNKLKNFSQLAKEKSIDPISSKNGGDIGWISENMIPNEIKDANLSYKNQVSKIIPFGDEFLIVQLNDILPSRKKDISEVSDIIIKKIKYKKSIHLYHKLKNKIFNLIKKNPKKLDLIIKENHITPIETDWFDEKSIPQVLNHAEIKKNIFNNYISNADKKLQTSYRLVMLNKHQSFILNIQDHKNKKIKKFSSIKNRITKILKKQKAIKEIKKQAKKVLFELKQNNFNLFKKLNLNFNNSEIISRYDSNPITSIIFSLPHPKKTKKIYTMYEDKDKNYIIALLDEIYYEDFSSKEKDTIIKYLEKNNTEKILNALIKNLRETAVIKYEKIGDI